jgi:hypothetical protein
MAASVITRREDPRAVAHCRQQHGKSIIFLLAWSDLIYAHPAFQLWLFPSSFITERVQPAPRSGSYQKSDQLSDVLVILPRASLARVPGTNNFFTSQGDIDKLPAYLTILLGIRYNRLVIEITLNLKQSQ